ncbi:VWA domain-containing protein [Myxococcota bacterium]|nr:VWA domain-containing protein [Myxococcota bacterium]
MTFLTRTHTHPITVALVCAAGLVSSVAGAAPIEPKVETDLGAVLAGAPSVVHVLVELDVPRGEGGATRPPVNLGLVIDRSGSMEERGKIEYAREAAIQLVRALAPSDRLALVIYDHAVDTVWPARPVGPAREQLIRTIRGIETRGSTNLTAGMVRGIDELRAHVADGTVSRVVLLTDGLANQGIVEPAKIAELARAGKKQGVRVTAMGLGAQYDEDLLESIAESGGGRYAFIEHPSQMARLFADELAVLQTQTAKNVVVRWDAGDRATKVEVVGWAAKTEGKRTTIEQEDLYAGEKRALLLRVELAAGVEGDFRLGTLLVEWTAIEGNEKKAFEKELQLVATPKIEVVDAARNARVVAEAELITADRDQVNLLGDYQRGDEAEARRKLGALEQKLAKSNEALKDKRIAKKLEALRLESTKMTEANASPTTKSIYLKKGKMIGKKAAKGKRAGWVLEKGAEGYEVERLQRALQERGLYAGAIDGQLDDDVAAAIEQYQKKEGLDPDGVAGPATLDRLGLY